METICQNQCFLTFQVVKHGKLHQQSFNGQLFFQDGREKFSDYYFIDYGDFIVFESVGTDSAEDDDSSFHLIDEVSSDSEETQLDS